MTDLIIRPMSPDDLQLAVDWAAEEGWNPGLDDVPSFLAAGLGGLALLLLIVTVKPGPATKGGQASKKAQ